MSIGKWFGFGKNEAYDRATTHFHKGEFEQAAELYQQSLETLDSQSARLAEYYLAESWRQAGLDALHSNRYKVAAEYLSQAATLQPGFADLRLNLALAHRWLGDEEEQDIHLRAAIGINPKYARAQLLMAMREYEKGAYEEGWAAIERAVKLDPALMIERYRLAEAAHLEAGYERCIAHLNQVMLIERNDANSYARTGDDHARKKKFEEAVYAYKRALDMEPTYADVHCKLAQALLELDRVNEAIDHLDAALQINARYVDAIAIKGIALRRKGDEEGARKAFAEALELNPTHAIAERESMHRKF